ncbi:MAG: CD225/dispanin family protein [Muribaculaceae bacterium]|nr:CD225/dispanin family protein [Muribaculaceae bacterium]
MKFYIAENGKPAGPFEAQELLAHGLTVNSQVWNESMEGWQRASNVPELMALLSQQQAMQPQQPQYQPPTGYDVTPNPEAQPPQNEQPTFGQPEQPPQFAQPQYGQPQQQYGQPQQQYGQPQYGQPQPQYGQPQYGQPQPQFGQQQWAQPQYQQMQAAVPPNDWKVASIIVTIFSSLCCFNPLALICGIVGIVYASKVNDTFYRGDHIGAENAAKTAKTWTLVAIGLIVLGFILFFLLLKDPDFMDTLQEGFESV